MNKISEEIERQLILNYRNIVMQQFILAKYGLSFEYSDGLSYKEREVFLEVLMDDVLPKISGGSDGE